MQKSPPLPILILSIIAIPIFLFNFIYYVTEVYLQFIHYHPTDLGAYLASGYRFSCRLGYIISFIGLVKMRRWGFYLCLGIWLSQLISSLIYFIINDINFTSHLYSGIQLLVYLIIVLPYWKKLKSVDTVRYIVIFFIVSIVLHSFIYFS